MNARFFAVSILRAVSAALLGLFLLSGIARSQEANVTLSLDQAIAQKQVEVQISGRNISTGDSMWLLIRRTPSARATLNVSISPGTMLVSASGKAQRMAVQKVKYEVTQKVHYRQTQKIVLVDNQWRTYLLEAYCCDFGKPTPRPSDKYTVQMQVEPKAEVILARGARAQVNPKVLQAALWIDINGVDGQRISRSFQLTQDEIDAAMALLKAPDDAPELDLDLSRLVEKISAAQKKVVGTAEITADRTTLRVPFVRSEIGELRRGDRVKVMAKMPKNLAVLAMIGGVERSGVIPVEDARILDAPAIGGGGGIAAALEAFTKRDETSVESGAATEGQPRQY